MRFYRAKALQDDKMQLTICSPQLGISPQSNLGGEVHDREVIKNLCDLGVKVIVILPRNKSYQRHKNLKVYYLPLPFVWPPYLFNFLIIPWLFWIFKKHKFNILRIHSSYFAGLGALFFSIFHPRIPLIMTHHHLEEENRIFDFINRLTIKRWDFIISNSEFGSEEIISKYKVEKKKIKRIYPGISRELKPRVKNKDLIKRYKLDSKKMLIYFGGLKKRKNLYFLLQLIKSLQNDQLKLLLCGSGPELRRLELAVKKLKLEDKVVLTGFVADKEKIDHYNLADIFVFPSKKEGFGLSPVEAAACGVPAIVSDVSSLKEIVINNKTGYLAKLNDIDDWEQKIKKLLRDKNLRKKMGQSARKYSQNFSWKKAAKNQLLIFKSVLMRN